MAHISWPWRGRLSVCSLLVIASSSASSALVLVIYQCSFAHSRVPCHDISCTGWNFILCCPSSFFNSLPTTSWVTGSLDVSIRVACKPSVSCTEGWLVVMLVLHHLLVDTSVLSQQTLPGWTISSESEWQLLLVWNEPMRWGVQGWKGPSLGEGRLRSSFCFLVTGTWSTLLRSWAT